MKMRNKYFTVTALAVLAVLLGVSIVTGPSPVDEGRSFSKVIDGMTIFEDIDELSFLDPYVTEELNTELPEHVQTAYSVELEYNGEQFMLTAYTFETQEYARAFFSRNMALPPELTFNSRGVLDSVKHEAYAEATHGCSYYIVSGSNTEVFPKLVSFISEHLSTPVDGGESQ